MNNLRKISLIGFMLFSVGQEVKSSLPLSISMFRHPQSGQIILNMGEAHTGLISQIVDVQKRQLVEQNKKLFLDLLVGLQNTSILLELNSENSLQAEDYLSKMPEDDTSLSLSLLKKLLTSFTEKRKFEIMKDFGAIAKRREEENSNVKFVFADVRTRLIRQIPFFIDFYSLLGKLKTFIKSAAGNAYLANYFIKPGRFESLDKYPALLYLLRSPLRNHFFDKNDLLTDLEEINDDFLAFNNFSRTSEEASLNVFFDAFEELIKPLKELNCLSLNQKIYKIKSLKIFFKERGIDLGLSLHDLFEQLIKKISADIPLNVNNDFGFVLVKLIELAEESKVFMCDIGYAANIQRALYDDRKIIISLVGNTHVKNLNQFVKEIGFEPVFQAGDFNYVPVLVPSIVSSFSSQSLAEVYERITRECLS